MTNEQIGMGRNPSKTTQAILSYIITYKCQHDGLSPTYRQIMRGVGISSTSVVAYHIRHLEVMGRLRLGPGGRGLMVPGGQWSLS